ncbi:hypothetical protein CGCA056_v003941 [Colletotrichum aenigma]|uniref:uncharacterized protein n=1 Tax=Colletotrichum aenigma TaxID=1215731 RepID=UPI001872ED4C|nr:uncharacterized protein CGCA056_v015189 [Colletotrichum aenigma]XP_037171282.1 uncharacterized protein CGCA056_v015086 [Colletotrichum aenigma]XP_037171572.1 uncharacterized protein CGCA056_v014945 [Colletotrichum aenigma]XP_037174054.1 uncharacterized protein CGCA056_v012741 [Colletotrichum aenigma]XP_037176857.1 uncharacterized protein CGCA056_v010283 [Colletotrichum aenigma]XP_037177349.1 uncharacterized protein CGCA056_v007660 [Colletotrichum aenigma]XP_037182249.1 uncharacterized prot
MSLIYEGDVITESLVDSDGLPDAEDTSSLDHNNDPFAHNQDSTRQHEDEGDNGWDGHRWAVDHSSGHHRFRARRFIEKVLRSDFEPADAIKMLQEKHTIDFGSRAGGSAPAKATDAFFPQFFLDFFSIVGKPRSPITKSDGPVFDNIEFSLESYAAPYSAKHIGGIPFDITGRTFRVAKAGTREVWFVVMHPVAHEPTSRGGGPRERQTASEKSGMPAGLARELAAYIVGVFQSPQLLGEGVEACWRLGTKSTQRISSAKWQVFQQQFMDGWAVWASNHNHNSFWRRHEPAFHAYDYGANIEIQVSDSIYDLPRERHIPYEEEEEEEEEEGGEQGPRDGNVQQDIEELSLNDEQRTHSDAVDGREYQQMLRESRDLQRMIIELDARFDLSSISAISYALAVCINSESGSSQTRCLLADRNMVAREYPGNRDYTFYPQAFHPTYGNFSSSQPPAFLNSLYTAIQGNMSDRNEGADVLSFGYFQGYSNIKRSVRHSASALLATKGYATAALTAPTSHTSAMSYTRDRRERLLRCIRGDLTPEQPEESKPFARERRQLDIAIEKDEVAYRMEQVVSLNIRHMDSVERTFENVIRPIFQLMRFFLTEHESYVHIFRSIPVGIFPRIMSAYCRLFELAICEMERRYVAGGERGLDLAHSEAVAVLDRLGGYIFTGHERHLPKTVLRPLGTIDSLLAGAWPYIDPAVLDLAPAGAATCFMDTSRWPRSAKTGRLILLHISELQHHYGDRLASHRETEIWFSQLGRDAFKSHAAVTEYVTELMREMWIPQTKLFIANQLRRRLQEGSSDTGSMPITLEQKEACKSAVEAWEAAPDAFTHVALQRLIDGLTSGGSRIKITLSRTRTRHDFATQLLRVVSTEKGRAASAPVNATWPDHLQAAITSGNQASNGLKPDEWVSVIASRLLAAGVEWVPDAVKGRLTSTTVVSLCGREVAHVVVTGPPGSLRRAAQEAQIKHEKAAHDRALRQTRRTINFGCSFPFTDVPSLITDGFLKAKAIFSNKGDIQVLDHYQLAINVLYSNIEDPLCCLMLMITLTVCSSSETPEVAPGSRKFGTAAKRKDPAQLALVMVTRMMWFLYPASFPWKKGSSGTAYDVAEMTKKIEHKGCSNRMLRELGWVTSKSNRDSPRNTDLQLRPQEDLLQTLRELRSAMKRPDDFISVVFNSQDSIWTERCASIIKDR